MSLTVENIKKSFDDNLIFENISFRVFPGEVVSLQGKSGEGKTTMLRCINALETLDRGSIKILDKFLCKDDGSKAVYAPKDEMKIIRRDIGFVFQNFNLFPHMTVYENLIQGPLYANLMDKDEMDKRAAELLEYLDLTGKEGLYPFQLSGGQQQRVAIARACMLSPKVLCFDEPTSALDPSTIGQIEDIIRKLSSQKMAILIVTHDVNFAQNISNRILHFENKVMREEVISALK